MREKSRVFKEIELECRNSEKSLSNSASEALIKTLSKLNLNLKRGKPYAVFMITFHVLELLALGLPRNLKIRSTAMNYLHNILISFNINSYSETVHGTFMFTSSLFNLMIILIFVLHLSICEKAKFSCLTKVIESLLLEIVGFYTYLLMIPMLNIACIETMDIRNDILFSKTFLAIFILITTFLIAFFITVWRLSLFYTNENDLLATYDSNGEFLALGLKFGACAALTSDRVFNVALIAGVFLTLIVDYSVRVPFFNRFVSQMYAVLLFLALSISVCYLPIKHSLVTEYIYDPMQTIFVLIALSIRFGMSYRSFLLRRRLFKKNDYISLKNDLDMDLFIRELKHFYTTAICSPSELESHTEVSHIFMHHIKTCLNLSCYCKTINFSSPLDYIGLRSQFWMIVNEILRSNNNKVIINGGKGLIYYIAFLTDLVGSSNLAMRTILINEKLQNGGIKSRMAVKMLFQHTHKITEQKLTSISGVYLNFAELTCYETAVIKLELKVRNFLMNFLEFMLRLEHQKDEDTVLFPLFALARGSALDTELAIIKDITIDLLELNPDSLRLMKIALEIDNLFDEDINFMAQIHRNELKRINMIKEREKKGDRDSEEHLDIFNPSAGVIFLNMSSQVGRIEKVSQSISKLFNSPIKDILGKNIKVFMPSVIANRHDELMMQFIQSDRAALIRGKAVSIFAVDKHGYLVTVNLNIRVDTFFKDNFLMSGLLTRNVSCTKSILCDSLGNILNYSEDIDSDLGLSQIKEKRPEKLFNISVLVPSLFWKLFPNDGGEMKEEEKSDAKMLFFTPAPSEAYEYESEIGSTKVLRSKKPRDIAMLYRHILDNIDNPENAYKIKFNMKKLSLAGGSINLLLINIFHIIQIPWDDEENIDDFEDESEGSNYNKINEDKEGSKNGSSAEEEKTSDKRDKDDILAKSAYLSIFQGQARKYINNNLGLKKTTFLNKPNHEQEIKMKRGTIAPRAIKNNTSGSRRLTKTQNPFSIMEIKLTPALYTFDESIPLMSPPPKLPVLDSFLSSNGAMSTGNRLVPATNNERILNNFPQTDSKSSKQDASSSAQIKIFRNKRPSFIKQKIINKPLKGKHTRSTILLANNTRREGKLKEIVAENQSEASSTASSQSVHTLVTSLDAFKTSDIRRLKMTMLTLIILLFCLIFIIWILNKQRWQSILEELEGSLVFQDILVPLSIYMKNFIIYDFKKSGYFEENQVTASLFEYLNMSQISTKSSLKESFGRSLRNVASSNHIYLYNKNVNFTVSSANNEALMINEEVDMEQGVGILLSHLIESENSELTTSQYSRTKSFLLNNFGLFIEQFFSLFDDIQGNLDQNLEEGVKYGIYCFLLLIPLSFLINLFIFYCIYKIKINTSRLIMTLKNFNKATLHFKVKEIARTITDLYPSFHHEIRKMFPGLDDIIIMTDRLHAIRRMSTQKFKAKAPDLETFSIEHEEEVKLKPLGKQVNLKSNSGFLREVLIGMTSILIIPISLFLVNYLLQAEFKSRANKIIETKHGIQNFSADFTVFIVLKHVELSIQGRPEYARQTVLVENLLDELDKNMKTSSNPNKILAKDDDFINLLNLNRLYYFSNSCAILQERGANLNFTGVSDALSCNQVFKGAFTQGMKTVKQNIDELFEDWEISLGNNLSAVESQGTDKFNSPQGVIFNTDKFNDLQYSIDIFEMLRGIIFNDLKKIEFEALNPYTFYQNMWLGVGLTLVLTAYLLIWIILINSAANNFFDTIKLLKVFPASMVMNNKSLLHRIDILFKRN